jgi:hypothetical protein
MSLLVFQKLIFFKILFVAIENHFLLSFQDDHTKCYCKENEFNWIQGMKFFAFIARRFNQYAIL